MRYGGLFGIGLLFIIGPPLYEMYTCHLVEEGHLNWTEVGFLPQYVKGALMSIGVLVMVISIILELKKGDI